MTLLTGASLALPAILTPGPFQAFLLSETLRHGVRRTVPAAFAPLLTDGLIIALVLTVLRALPPAGLAALRLAGGALLLWIAASFLRHQARPVATTTSSPVQGSLVRAVGMNLLNPNPYIFWGVVAGPILLQAWESSAGHAVAFLVGFYGVFVGGLVLLVLAFGGAVGAHPRLRRGLGWVAAAALTVFGLVQVGSAVRTLTS